MKKIILLCFLLSLIPIQRAEAQSLSPVFRKDYEGAGCAFFWVWLDKPFVQ